MKVLIAKSFKDRFFGLMNKRNIDYGLLFNNCKSIHTFFMRENIDVILLDKNNKVLKINRNIKPNRILIFNYKKRTNILELPSNSSLNIHINDIIDLNNL
ncbi:MAG: DUF192 domain-containing protein [Bacilli bacterium]|nr:DUF192 domain-containing protein [Bacilli bacterium]